MNPARKIHLVEPLGEKVIRLMAEREQARAWLAGLDQEIAESCRLWSDRMGYKVRLREEQVKREIEGG